MSNHLDITIDGPAASLDYRIRATREETPPRCRKPRPVTRTVEGAVPLRVLDPEQAPVVVEVVEHEVADWRPRKIVAYRGVDGVLLRPIEPLTALLYDVDTDGPDDDSIRTALAATAARVVVIDGQAWGPAPEPVYHAITFGLGGNHGGTSLSVTAASDDRWQDVWPATMFAEAVAATQKIAVGRGDVQSLGRIEDPSKTITVHDPSYVKVRDPRVVARESRRAIVDDLHSLARDLLALSGEEPMEYEAMVNLRRRLDAAETLVTHLWA